MLVPPILRNSNLQTEDSRPYLTTRRKGYTLNVPTHATAKGLQKMRLKLLSYLTVGVVLHGCTDGSDLTLPTGHPASTPPVVAHRDDGPGGDDGDSEPGDFGCTRYQDYAPPGIWGQWEAHRSHIGSVEYSGTASPVSSTSLQGGVRYWSVEDVQEEDLFIDSFSVMTGNSVGNLELRFMGIPYGTTVTRTICAGGGADGGDPNPD